MLNAIIVIIVAIFLFLLLWKLMKNVVKALVIVAVLLLLFSGIIFVRDYMILRDLSSSDTLIVLERDEEPVIGIKDDEVIREDFSTPYIAVDMDKLDLDYSSDELVEMLNSDSDLTRAEGVKLLKDSVTDNLMSYLDKEIIKFKPEPYFMSLLKGTFTDRVKDDANLVGDAIRSNIRNLTN